MPDEHPLSKRFRDREEAQQRAVEAAKKAERDSALLLQQLKEAWSALGLPLVQAGSRINAILHSHDLRCQFRVDAVPDDLTYRVVLHDEDYAEPVQTYYVSARITTKPPSVDAWSDDNRINNKAHPASAADLDKLFTEFYDLYDDEADP